MLVYTLAQRQIRAALRENKSTIRNQLGKPTAKPTLRWIFQCFKSIHLVTSNDQSQISNQNKAGLTQKPSQTLLTLCPLRLVWYASGT
ncbi:hypothetical protein PN435_12720, partial [Nodularia spumigena CS-590/02]|nr:hypothetical protein [Nodularia spumigena CS-590/02]